MELSSKKILSILEKNGVQSLFHANTVQTACGFLSKGRLLSRGTQDEMGLPMSQQMTDGIDVEHGLWYDLFVDTIDIHTQFKNRNFYGPVLFELDINILKKKWLPYVWIMKSNPSNWNTSTKFEDKYFFSADDFEKKFQFGQVDKLFSFRNIGGVIRLKDCLKRIILDHGGLSNERQDARIQAIGALFASAQIGGLVKPEIAIRNCLSNCGCKSKYTSPQMSDATYMKFFSPYAA